MDTIVEGRLSCWGLGEQGGWWGLVSYDVSFGGDKQAVTHWVPAWVLKMK